MTSPVTRPTTPTVLQQHATQQSPLHAPHGHMQQHQQQHMILSAQPSYDQQTFDVSRTQLFKSESSLYPLFTTHQQHVQQKQQHMHMQHMQSSSQQRQHPVQQQSLHPTQHMQQQQQHMQQGYRAPQQPSSGNWGYSHAQTSMQDSNSGYPEHMLVSKQLSDPDSVSSSDNPHPKLRRQLTLNPSNDHRLAKMTKAATHQKSLPMIGQFGGLQTASGQYQHVQHLPNVQMPAGQQINTYPSGSCNLYQGHEQLSQPPPQPGVMSQDTTKAALRQQLPSLPSHMYPHGYSHPHVMRNSSDPNRTWSDTNASSQYHNIHVPPTITRLNSTSDPHLNLYEGNTDSPHYMSEPFDEIQDQHGEGDIAS